MFGVDFTWSLRYEVVCTLSSMFRFNFILSPEYDLEVSVS